jgi:endo-1,4-beta-xylanase
MKRLLKAILLMAVLVSLGYYWNPATTGAQGRKDPSLKDIYGQDFMVGVAVHPGQYMGKGWNREKASGLITRHFNAVTPENVMKAEHLQPTWGEFKFSVADSLVSFCKRSGIQVNGHTLVWHSQMPQYARRMTSSDSFRVYFENHIKTVASHFKGQLESWDVVNEALNEDGTLRRSPFLRHLGESYLVQAFKMVAQIDPSAKLYYNDYNNEQPAKRAGCIELVKKIQAAGVKIDGVGIQGHWQVGRVPFQHIEESILAYAALGLKVAITELDIEVLPRQYQGAEVGMRMQADSASNPYQTGLPEQVQKQLASDYAQLFKLFHKHRDKISRVTLWGLTDGDSWLNGWPIRGRTNHPLLFDRNYLPKPAFYAVVQARDNGSSLTSIQ